MTDIELTDKLETLVGEFGETRRQYFELLDGKESEFEKVESILTLERRALLAVAANKPDLLTNKNAIMFLNAINRPTVEEKAKIVEMELGESGHLKAVLDYKLKLLEKELKTLEAATIHAASLRKGERF